MELDRIKLIETCDFISRITTEIGGMHHGSAWLWNQCMRAMDNSALPAQSITFSVFLNAPVMKPGEVTIYRDGTYEVRRTA